MSDWPGWVLPLAIGFGIVLLGILVFFIVLTGRKDKTSGSSFESSTTGNFDALESELWPSEPSDEAKASSAKVVEPEFRAPGVSRTQAVGFGWAKASDLAEMPLSEGDQNPDF